MPATDNSHIELTIVYHFYFNQKDTATLDTLLNNYSQYSPDVLNKIQFVLVDDCSIIQPSISNNLNLNIRYMRILDDITWNQAGARNLAVTYASADKVVVTDLDLQLPEKTLKHLLKVKNPRKTMYKFPRFDHEGKKLHSHPNTFFFSRGRFLQFHGCDEIFAGAYGYEDVFFYKWQQYNGTRFIKFGDQHRIIHTDIKRESSYHSLIRDETKNEIIFQKKIENIKKYGSARGHSRIFLNFKWDFIEDKTRKSNLPEPSIRKFWSKNWILRWLSPY